MYGSRTVRGILHDLIHDSGRIFSRTPPRHIGSSAPAWFVLQRSTAHAPTRLPSLISIQLYARARWSVRSGTAGTQRGRASGRGLRTDTKWVRPQYDPALRTRQSSHPTADRNWAELGHDECPPPPVRIQMSHYSHSPTPSPYHSRTRFPERVLLRDCWCCCASSFRRDKEP